MEIRKYQPSDCKVLAELFYHTVHTVNVKDYTEAQANAWATGDWIWKNGIDHFRSTTVWLPLTMELL